MAQLMREQYCQTSLSRCILLSILKSETQYKIMSEEIVNKTCQRQHINKINTPTSSTIYQKCISNKLNQGCQLNYEIITDYLPQTSCHKIMVAKNEGGSQQETDYQQDAQAS